MKKPRRSVSFSEPQVVFLEAFAETRGMTFAEMVRWIIDNYRERIGELEKMGVKL
jgi:hypothetical protein